MGENNMKPIFRKKKEDTEFYELNGTIYFTKENEDEFGLFPIDKLWNNLDELGFPLSLIHEKAPVACKCGNTLLEVIYLDEHYVKGHCNECGRTLVITA